MLFRGIYHRFDPPSEPAVRRLPTGPVMNRLPAQTQLDDPTVRLRTVTGEHSSRQAILVGRKPRPLSAELKIPGAPASAPPQENPSDAATRSFRGDRTRVERRPATPVPTRPVDLGEEPPTIEAIVESFGGHVVCCDPLSSAQAHPDAIVTDAPTEANPESRYDPISGQWTLFAAARNRRPMSRPEPEPEPDESSTCPFCLGREDRTPSPVWVAVLDPDQTVDHPAPRLAEHLAGPQQANGDGLHEVLNDPSLLNDSSPDAERWNVRVIPNLYPAVAGASILDASPGPPPQAVDRSGSNRWKHLFEEEPAIGGHEVIVESPRHIRSLTELNVSEVGLVFAAYAGRLRYWAQQPGIRYVSVFKNVGREAGASLQHGHSQVIALNRLPASVGETIGRFRKHRGQVGHCLMCDLTAGELESGQRIVAMSDSLVAYCPHASRFPMSVRLTSRAHQARFETLSTSMIGQIARLTQRLVRWIEAIVPGVSYNLVLNSYLPLRDEQGRAVDPTGSTHWSLELIPRVTRLAGYELSSQGTINPVLPEQAAAFYRAEARKTDPRIALRE